MVPQASTTTISRTRARVLRLLSKATWLIGRAPPRNGAPRARPVAVRLLPAVSSLALSAPCRHHAVASSPACPAPIGEPLATARPPGAPCRGLCSPALMDGGSGHVKAPAGRLLRAAVTRAPAGPGEGCRLGPRAPASRRGKKTGRAVAWCSPCANLGSLLLSCPFAS